MTSTLKEFRQLTNSARRQIFWYLFNRQLFNSGFRAIYINSLIAIVVGWGLMSQAYVILPQSDKIAEQYAQFFVVFVIRELGPLISGVILISRSGTAITSEIGYLNLFDEFETLHEMRMNSVFVFLLPVFCAFPLSLLLMFFYFDVICVLSSYLVIFLFYGQEVEFVDFVVSIVQQISAKEVAISILKAVIGGAVIGITSIYYGASVGGRFTDISRAISNATTMQLFTFFVLNIALSILAYR